MSSSKLLDLPATFAWKFDPGHPASVACTADIDGDGRDELIVTTAQEASAIACVSVVSYAQPGELDPGWSADDSPLLVVQWSAPAGIPNWQYPPAAPPQSCTNFTYVAADVDNDGRQEIIAFFPGYSGASPSLGVLKWSAGNLNCLFQATGSVPGSDGSNAWTLAAGLQVYAVHNLDGTGGDLLLLVQPGAAVGVLKWSAGALTCVWQASGSIPGTGGAPAWALNGTEQFVSADVDNDKRNEVTILAPALVGETLEPNPAMGLLKWANGSLNVIWQVSAAAGNNPGFVATNQQTFALDVDGSGTIRLVVLGALALAVVEWQQGTFNAIWQCSMTVPGAKGVQDWTLNTGGFMNIPPDNVYVADLDGSGDGLFIVAASSALTDRDARVVPPQAPAGGYLKWQNSGMFCVWQGNAKGWGLGPGNQLFPARMGTTWDSLFAYAPGDSVGILTWSASSHLACTYQVQYCVPAWNLNFILGLPSTPFTPFTGTQLALYQQISSSLTPPALGRDHVTGDIRYQYGNLTNSETFSGWATQIKDMTPISGYSQADWDAVAPVISAEAGWVGTMYGFSSDMTGFAQAVFLQQDADLAHDMANMTLDPYSAPNPVPYWVGAVVDAALWGLAAIPGGFIFQASMAVAASLFGSYISEPSSGPTPPKTVQYYQFKAAVDSFFSQALSGTSLDLQTVVTDPVKLAVCGRLAEGAWYWGIEDNTTVAANGQNPNRIMLYQMLMAAQFSLFVWTKSPTIYPTHRWLDFQNNCEVEVIDAPIWAYWSIPNSDGTFTVSLLAQGTIDEGGGGVNLVAFPVEALMTDLFTNLQVLPADITFQRFGWDKIPNPPNTDMC